MLPAFRLGRLQRVPVGCLGGVATFTDEQARRELSNHTHSCSAEQHVDESHVDESEDEERLISTADPPPPQGPATESCGPPPRGLADRGAALPNSPRSFLGHPAAISRSPQIAMSCALAVGKPFGGLRRPEGRQGGLRGRRRSERSRTPHPCVV